MNKRFPYKNIFITGASSGLGYALAVEFADTITRLKVTNCHLGLVARREDKLTELKQRISSQYLQVHNYVSDVSDDNGMKVIANSFLESAGSIDLVIANAGISSGTRVMPVSTEKQNFIFRVNVIGVVNTLNPFLDTMMKQRSGHIAVVGSVAGFRGLPGGSYSASKSAVRTLMDSWRLGLDSYNIHVTTLCPGFVESEITSGKKNLPFLIDAQKASKLMIKGLLNRKKTYVFPTVWRFVVPLLKILPDSLIRKYG